MVGLRHHYLGPEEMFSPDASSLFADFAGLPPLLFQSSESEMLRDDSLRAAARAHAAGVTVEVELYGTRCPMSFRASRRSRTVPPRSKTSPLSCRHAVEPGACRQHEPGPGSGSPGRDTDAPGLNQRLRTTTLPIE